MIDRYSREEMRNVWSEEAKFQAWLDVEILIDEAWSKLGEIPAEDVEKIRKNAKFSVERIQEIEQETRHDVVAFTRCVSESLGPEKKWVHYGVTSTDVVDTANGIRFKKADAILRQDILDFMDILKENALKYKDTIMMGRTHGVHAEITSFGLKFALWYEEMKRNLARFDDACADVECGKISGAVGTYADIDPFVEKYVCEHLGIAPSPISSQTLQRDHHAEYVTTLAVIASSIDKMATEIRHLQRTEVREAEEYFSPKQKGSSIMPHKRNPITCERMCGLARVIRGNAQAALEDVALWHERDISHSSVERVILPDSTIALDYMLQTFTRVIDKLLVYPDKMMKDLNLTGGLIYSPIILNTLVEKGAVREQAYRWVQRNAMKRWLEGEDFLENLKKDEDVTKYMTAEEIEGCFDVKKMLSHVDTIFARFGI